MRYTLIEEWPPLAWLARCTAARPTVEVFHGERVETREDWFCEAVWDGDFESGDFDRTDVVFGSGGRIRGETVTFVSSTASVDRLQAIEAGGQLWVSNSLVCLLAAVDGRVDPTRSDYVPLFKSIGRGIKNFQRELSTSSGTVSLTYCNNLVWNGRRRTEVAKPLPLRDFGSFAKYRTFLEDSIRGLADNMSSAGRERPFRMLGTISSGYDAATVAALARPHGLREIVSFTQARGEQADSGEEIAKHLGLKVTLIERDAWRSGTLPEVPFLAADAKGEDVYFGAVADRLAGRVLLTGNHGDRVWGKQAYPGSESAVHHGQSGLSLCEFRLWTGFLHCPVAFLGVGQIREIKALSRSDELSDWDVPGNYSRPICRRVVEDAGVPRELFGAAKKAASVLFARRGSFLSDRSMADYMDWIESNSAQWIRRGRVPPLPMSRIDLPVRVAAASLARGLRRVTKLNRRKLRPLATRISRFAGREPLFRHLFPWALERAQARYRTARIES